MSNGILLTEDQGLSRRTFIQLMSAASITLAGYSLGIKSVFQVKL